ncbi:hypothetical protein QP027_11580 [Corynebacterium breve]|uniref:Uncharacterized protein n=1 Tax=Corynebacterium breve TaxID=3049799 RepID=A0ABY8VF22_9CORY|nr:hypothetical protein [Corynebacterium breve]WIM67702.1 hypothetical protein QP027_11580 [Corynebacterium breve]
MALDEVDIRTSDGGTGDVDNDIGRSLDDWVRGFLEFVSSLTDDVDVT